MKKPLNIIAAIAAMTYLAKLFFIEPPMWGTTIVADILFAFAIFACVVLIGSFIQSLRR